MKLPHVHLILRYATYTASSVDCTHQQQWKRASAVYQGNLYVIRAVLGKSCVHISHCSCSMLLCIRMSVECMYHISTWYWYVSCTYVCWYVRYAFYCVFAVHTIRALAREEVVQRKSTPRGPVAATRVRHTAVSNALGYVLHVCMQYVCIAGNIICLMWPEELECRVTTFRST